LPPRDMYIYADAGHPFHRGSGPFSHFCMAHRD
jgi:hypothetical protein